MLQTPAPDFPAGTDIVMPLLQRIELKCRLAEGLEELIIKTIIIIRHCFYMVLFEDPKTLTIIILHRTQKPDKDITKYKSRQQHREDVLQT